MVRMAPDALRSLHYTVVPANHPLSPQGSLRP